MPVHMTVLRKIVAAFMLASMAAMVAVGLMVERAMDDVAEERWKDSQRVLAAVLADAIESDLRDLIGDIGFAARMPVFAGLPEATAIDPATGGLSAHLEPRKRAILERLREKTNRFAALMLLRPDGTTYLAEPFAAQHRLSRRDCADVPAFAAATRARGPVLSDGFVATGGMLASVVDAPIMGADGHIAGHLCGLLPLDQLSRMVGKDRIGGFDAGFLVDSSGRLVAHTDTGLLRDGNGEPFAEHAIVAGFLGRTGAEPKRAPEPGLIDLKNAEGTPFVGAFVPLPMGWGLGLVRKRHAMTDAIGLRVAWAMALVAAAVLLVGSIGGTAAYHFAKGWERAEEGLRAARDDLEVRVAQRTSELRSANRTLVRQMAERRRAEEALHESERRFRAIFDQAFQLVGLLRPDGTTMEANRSALAMIGGRYEDVIGRPFWDTPWWAHSPAERDRLRDAVAEAAAGRFVRFETTHKAVDGRLITVDFSLKPVTDEDGKVVLLIPEGRDITERKQAEAEVHKLNEDLERRVEERTAELRRMLEQLAHSNIELERFAYVASHDLQEPLRTISRFTQLLDRRYQGRLDAEADEFIAYIVGAAKHMSSLIADLLAYSRTASAGAGHAPVEACQPLARALGNLHAAIGESDASVATGELPTVAGDEGQLVQLFQNLIHNAIKFRVQGQSVAITIAAEPAEDGMWRFTVADNGIGIDQRFARQVFDIFKRLHTADAYPGTGIGLALCKRIVERHGGRIWVDPNPGGGSAFRFTLPSAAPVEAMAAATLAPPVGG